MLSKIPCDMLCSVISFETGLEISTHPGKCKIFLGEYECTFVGTILKATCPNG